FDGQARSDRAPARRGRPPQRGDPAHRRRGPRGRAARRPDRHQGKGAASVTPFDPRLTAARPDLAAKPLESKVAAARCVAGELHEFIASHAPLRRVPAPDAPLETEALKGERVMIYETTEEGFAWGQLEADGYVGWLPAEALRRPGQFPTHKVA